MIRVTIFNENVQDKEEAVAANYPNGIHGAISEALSCDKDIKITIATSDMPECGLTEAVLENTDVLFWWGHIAHHLVPDDIAKRVHSYVLKGMGAVFLHSAHVSKPFMLLMGTACTLGYRDGDKENLWTILPTHPIAQGVPNVIHLDEEEMYSEPFGVPEPDELVFVGWFSGGEIFRSGCCYQRGHGKVFYFQPGHETNPTYKNPDIKKILLNAAKWANPTVKLDKIDCWFCGEK